MIDKDYVCGASSDVKEWHQVKGTVKLCHLDDLGIIEISNAGIVKGDVSVLSDTHNNDVGGVLGKELAVSCDFLLGRCGGVNIVYALKGSYAENGVAQQCGKCRFRRRVSEFSQCQHLTVWTES